MKEILFAYQSYNHELNCYNPNCHPDDWMINGKKTLPLTHGGQFFTWESLNHDFSIANKLSYDELLAIGAKPSRQEYLNRHVNFKLLKDIPIGEKYIYHISVHQTEFFKFNNNHGFKFISPRVIEDVKNNIAKIVILFPYEGNTGIISSTNFESFVNNGALMVDHWCKNLGLTKDQVYFLNGNLLADEFNSIVTNYTSWAVDTFTIWVPSEFMHNELTDSVFEPISDKNLFLCYNRNVRFHRTVLLSMLKYKNLFNRGLISCGTVSNTEYILTGFRIYNQEFLTQAAREVFNLAPIELDKNLKTNNPAVNVNESHYKQTFISLIPETHCNDGILFRSEKIYKTLAAGHPFIILSCAGYLKSLKELGFKTFDKWVDETYDTEPAWTKRIDMITNEIKKFSEYPIEKLKDIREEMKSTIMHNKKLYKEIYFRDIGLNPLFNKVEQIWKSF
jgi:hypothetical protein